MNIVLIGMRGSGKTTVGKLLARNFNMKFADTDIMIEKKCSQKIASLIKRKGIEKFRKTESETIKDIAGTKNTIIATGGGVIENKINMALLKTNGFVVYLKTSPPVLFERIGSDKRRPLLTGAGNMSADLKALHKLRDPLYKKFADFVVFTDKLNVSQTVNKIIQNSI